MKNTIIDFSKTGGYKLKQATLNKMQETYISFLKTMVSFLGCAETGSYIICGCEIDGSNITPGYMYIDGELCPFAGVIGDGNTRINKVISTSNLSFKNGINYPVFREIKADKVLTGGTKWNDFIKFNYVDDPNYVSTENNFSDAWVSFLMTIEADAQKNVQADLDETNPAEDSFVKGKPAGNLLSYLYKGTINIGNPTTNDFRTVTFPTVVTASYMVVGSLVSNSGTYDIDNDVFWIISNKTATSFKLGLREIDDVTQDLNFDYCLIPL